jgi:anaphase-promoting complex subunit 3
LLVRSGVLAIVSGAFHLKNISTAFQTLFCWSYYSRRFTFIRLQFRCREALQLFDTLPKTQHNTGWVLHQEGRAYFEMADYQNAQRCLEVMQRVEPYRMKGLELLSTVLWQLKKEVDLAHLAQRAVDFDRLSPEAWCVVGNCFSLQKEHETALVFFGRSLQLDPSFTYTHTLSGYEYMANEDFEKAMACFRNGIRSDERHYNAWYGMGAIYHRQEKYDLAEYHFQRAVQINPQSSVLRCNLGMSQYSNGKPMLALQTLSEAFRLDPRNPQARFQRATIYLSLGRSEEALEELEKVRDAAPREATVHFVMGKVLKRLGRPEQAMRCFLTALDLDPKDNQLIKTAMDKLEEPDILDEEVTAF